MTRKKAGAAAAGGAGQHNDASSSRLADSGFADVTEQRSVVRPDERLPHLVGFLDRWEGFTATLGGAGSRRCARSSGVQAGRKGRLLNVGDGKLITVTVPAG